MHVAEKAKSRRTTRAVYAVYIALTAAFVISNIWQVGLTLFGDAPHEAVAQGPCRAGIEELSGALDRAAKAAVEARDDADAERRYSEARRPEWDRYEEVRRACAAQPRGVDAMAALTRLERAHRSAVGRSAAALAPVRREVDSFIR